MIATVGVLAHVDAGKTTFSEQALYAMGAIRRVGRVDDRDAFLDTHPLEKQRGITIFSGQARVETPRGVLQWLDTPGHADFSPEMERSLSVLDAAILLVSATEGVQSHTETLWRLLADYGVPTFIFLNKTDREAADPDGALARLRRLSEDVVDCRGWTDAMPDALREELALRDEALLERWPDGGVAPDEWLAAMAAAVRERRLFPAFAGSALTGAGVEGFLARLWQLLRTEYDPDAPVRGRVFRVRRDAQGQRLCFLKLLAGRLRVKDELATARGPVKVNELRLYHGDRYQTAECVEAGALVAVPLAEGCAPGEGVGAEPGGGAFRTEPMAVADVRWDEKQTPAFALMQALRQIEEEEPTLAVEQSAEGVSLRVMGRVQLEVLQRLLLDRFGVSASFGPCRVLYRETVAAPSVGVGHYEPLRHYAEVHLRLVPGPRGSGVRFRSRCHVDALALNWQRLVETHVLEKQHKGVLCGAPLTDVTVELLSGRAHLKHTEGGDFRQATYRAIRNALMYARSVLLEPVCRFRLRVPADCCGRLAGELSALGARLDAPEYGGEDALLTGEAFYARMLAFLDALPMLTHGRGSFDCRMDHDEPCPEADAVIRARAYNPLADDTPDSVFCQKGAGYAVPWNEVRAKAHLPVEPDADAP